uniref:Uncharacterized protein n=1 Tax=Arundo donax TaxID=35708 RepID=A0A0A9CYE1_ARUDO
MIYGKNLCTNWKDIVKCWICEIKVRVELRCTLMLGTLRVDRLELLCSWYVLWSAKEC